MKARLGHTASYKGALVRIVFRDDSAVQGRFIERTPGGIILIELSNGEKKRYEKSLIKKVSLTRDWDRKAPAASVTTVPPPRLTASLGDRVRTVYQSQPPKPIEDQIKKSVMEGVASVQEEKREERASSLSECLKIAFTRSGVDHRQLSRDFGLSGSAIENVLKGKNRPGDTLLHMLAVKFHLDEDTLKKKRDEMLNPKTGKPYPYKVKDFTRGKLERAQKRADLKKDKEDELLQRVRVEPIMPLPSLITPKPSPQVQLSQAQLGIRIMQGAFSEEDLALVSLLLDRLEKR